MSRISVCQYLYDKNYPCMEIKIVKYWLNTITSKNDINKNPINVFDHCFYKRTKNLNQYKLY